MKIGEVKDRRRAGTDHEDIEPALGEPGCQPLRETRGAVAMVPADGGILAARPNDFSPGRPAHPIKDLVGQILADKAPDIVLPKYLS